MISSSSSPSVRARLDRSVRRFTVGLATVVAATIAVGATASAQQPELPVNALAPEITAEADLAVDALDRYEASEDLADYLVYARLRTSTARLAARQLGYDEFAMVDAWKTADLANQRAVLAAMTQIGVPYRTNTSAEGEGFDCSGLTSYAWAAAGVELPRISGAQINDAERRDRATAQAGDLVHYPGHVMMYLGVDDAIVHSVSTGRTVELDTISDRRTDSVRFGDPQG